LNKVAFQAASPVAEPVSVPAQHEAWRALANAAFALAAVASALAGIGFLRPDSPSPPVSPCRSVATAINEFLVAKAVGGRSDRYLNTLRNSLSKFCRSRADRPLASVSVAEIEGWIHQPAWKPRTRQGYLADVSALFNWHLKRGQVASNPAAVVEVERPADAPPGIHSPIEVAAALRLAFARDKAFGRWLAIRYFAGLRDAEACRIEECNIMLEAGLIEVPAAKSKTRQRRLVTIQPNLRAWLGLGGVLPLVNRGDKWRAHNHALRAAGTTGGTAERILRATPFRAARFRYPSPVVRVPRRRAADVNGRVAAGRNGRAAAIGRNEAHRLAVKVGSHKLAACYAGEVVLALGIGSRNRTLRRLRQSSPG
jgi:integrase